MTIYDRSKNRGFLSIFALVSFAVLALPCLALGAGRAGGSSGGFRVSRPARQQTHLHGFHRRGFFDGDGFFGGDGFVGGVGFFGGDGGVIMVEQPQPTVIIQPQQPVHKGKHVQPRWVDGGYGVQVLEPGYWSDN